MSWDLTVICEIYSFAFISDLVMVICLSKGGEKAVSVTFFSGSFGVFLRVLFQKGKKKICFCFIILYLRNDKTT